MFKLIGKIRVRNENLLSVFLIQNICCGNSKEPSQKDGSFVHTKNMFKLMDKKSSQFYTQNFCLTGSMYSLTSGDLIVNLIRLTSRPTSRRRGKRFLC